MRSIAANAITLIIVAGVVIAGVAGYAIDRYRSPGPLAEPALFEVERGASLDEVAEDLAREGVIENAALFRIGARYEGLADELKFGEYEVPAGASPAEVLALLVSGQSIQYRITVAEGLTSAQVADLVREADVLVGEIPETPPEGLLAPDTYFVQRGDERGDVIERMKEAQRARLEEAWAARDPDIPLETPEEALVLASIIEKETGVASERARIAAVFHNRLDRGMRLQSDPTVIYGLTEGEAPLERGLTRSDLQAPNDWNTYVIGGLPPTPIANPGRDALFAAVQPGESDELYFVADGSGGHAFATSLEEHNRNVAAWRALERRDGPQ